MRHLATRLLIVFALLAQGLGSSWAASTMAAADVQQAAQISELPPCHQAAAGAEMKQSGMDCCGTGSCQCLMGCGVLPALSLSAAATSFQPQTSLLAEAALSALQAGHYGSALRPPATPQT